MAVRSVAMLCNTQSGLSKEGRGGPPHGLHPPCIHPMGMGMGIWGAHGWGFGAVGAAGYNGGSVC